jgi:type I restriction-modification system DNA methylase subunit
MPTPAVPYTHNVESYRDALAVIGWSPTPDPTTTDTIQRIVRDAQGNITGILLCVNRMPSLFLRIADEAISDYDELYKALVLGWNLEAQLTAVPWLRDLLRIYNTTYKPSKESIVRGEERPVAEFSLADVLDIESAQQITGQLVLLSPDTWRSQDYQEFLQSPTGQQRLTVDNALIRDLQGWRLALVRNLYERYPNFDLEDIDAVAQQVLDEIIFIRFCEDRGLTDLEFLFNLVTSSEGVQFLDRFQTLIRAYESLFDTSFLDPALTERVRPAPSVLQVIVAQAVEFYKFDLLDVDLLGRIYEEYLSYELKHGQRGLFYEIQLERRKQQGIYYTPSYIVDYIVGRALRVFQETNERPVSSALDPACGSGIFLTTLLKQLLRQRQDVEFPEKRGLLTGAIYGIDVDERAVRRAAQALYYTLLTGESHLVGHHLLPELLERNLMVKDSLLGRRQLIPGQRFDLIVSNPPYRHISGGELDEYQELYADVIFNRSDLCWLMLVAAIDNLVDGGIVAFIVPDNVLRTKEYTLLRKHVLDTTLIIEISYLNYQAFESTSLQNIILILQCESSEETRQANVIQVNYYATPGIFEREASDEIPQSGFYNEDLDYVFNVRLTAPVRAAYEKIKAQSEPMTDYFEVGQGIKPDRRTLYDAPVSRSCKRYLFGRDIQPYVVDWSGTYIEYALTKESQDPNVRPRTSDLFEVPLKLIVRKIVGGRLVTALDFEQYYVDSAAYVLLPRGQVSEDFSYLALAMLISRLAKFYYQVEYPERKTAFPQIRGADLERLPLPNTDLREENAPIIESIVAEAKSLYADVKAGKVEGSAVYQTPQTRRIDDLLSQLYGLTGTERALIDAYLEME